MKIFSNVASMKLARLKAGQLVECKGYYEAGDVEGLRYLLKDSGTADGYVDHELANGVIAELQYSGALNVKWAGAKGDGVSDQSALFTAVLESGDYGDIYIPEGTFYINSECEIDIASNTTITMHDNASFLVGFDVGVGSYNLISTNNKTNITLNNFTINGELGATSGDSADAYDHNATLIGFNSCSFITIKNLSISDWVGYYDYLNQKTAVVLFDFVTDSYISKIRIDGCEREYVNLENTKRCIVEDGVFIGQLFSAINQFARNATDDYTESEYNIIRNIYIDGGLGSAIDLGGLHTVCSNVYMIRCRKGINIGVEQFTDTTKQSGENISIKNCTFIPDTVSMQDGYGLYLMNTTGLDVQNYKAEINDGGIGLRITDCSGDLSGIDMIFTNGSPTTGIVSIAQSSPATNLKLNLRNSSFICSDAFMSASELREFRLSRIGNINIDKCTITGFCMRFSYDIGTTAEYTRNITNCIISDKQSTNATTTTGGLIHIADDIQGTINIRGNTFETLDATSKYLIRLYSTNTLQYFYVQDNIFKADLCSATACYRLDTDPVFVYSGNVASSGSPMLMYSLHNAPQDTYNDRSVGWVGALVLPGGMYIWATSGDVYVNATQPTDSTDGTKIN